MTQEPHILLFDGVCNLCNAGVQFIIKRDKKSIFKFAALQSDFGQALLKKHNLPLDNFETFVYIQKGQVFIKSTAALKVAKDLGGIWSIFYVFIILPKFIRDFLYSLIANSRYKIFGRQESCMLPTPELKSRFLG